MASKAEEPIVEDTEELIPVDTPPAAESAANDADDDESEDEDDKRLAGKDDAEEDSEEDDGFRLAKDRKPKKKRTWGERRERARQDRQRDALEKQFLLQQVNELRQRLGHVEGIAVSSNEANLDQRIAEADREFRTATALMAKAMEAGNSEDFATAMDIRDSARDTVRSLQFTKQQTAAVRQQPQQQPADPRVEHYKNRWVSDNSDWYGKPGYEDDTQIANAIDQAVAREGYQPHTEDYWLELNRRLSSRLGGAAQSEAAPRRQPPPQGRTREHVPPGARQREVYVTPERKAAMIEAGYWEDPVKRAKMLKTFIEYDKNQPAR